MIELLRTSGSHPDFAYLVAELDKALWEQNGELQAVYGPHNKVPENITAIIAYHDKKPVGCGCFKPFDPDTIEIKRMYVEPALRGKGIAASILIELEAWGRELEFSRSLLETGTNRMEAIRLYKKAGYIVIDNYGPYVGLETSVCMEKDLQ